MEHKQSKLDFRLMSLAFKARDLWRPRLDILREAGIEPGDSVLDFGCGPGSYIVPLARLVGNSGQVYAIDIHPLAIRAVERLAAKNSLANVKTIHSDRATGLPDATADVILLYDIIHDLEGLDGVLVELQRVLKPGGTLSVSDHHLKEDEIIAKVTGSGLFVLAKKGRNTLSFAVK